MITVLLNDNGGTANGGVDQSVAQTFTITINSVNDMPSFTKGNNVIVNEDATVQTIYAWALDISAGPDEAMQTLKFQISNNNQALFSVQPTVNASGDLSFTPAPDATGVATVTLALLDNGGSANGGVNKSADQNFTITITSINDAPSFTKGQDIMVNEDAQPYNSMWATNISSGDAGQAVSFVVTAQNSDLFTVQPAVHPSGVLSFELNPDAFGSSAITVYLKDDGGTANGGTDQSAVITFNIIVSAVNDAPQMDPVPDLTVPINNEPVVINLTGIHSGAGEESQQLTIEAFSENVSILPDPQLTPLQNGTTSLTLSPLTGVTGTVAVTIKLKDNGGTVSGGEDESIVSFVLTVADEVQSIFLPNFFTPNGNGMNDGFRVRGAGIEQIQFRVFNSQGQELFNTTDIREATETGWTGKYKGSDLPAGTYTWTLQGRYINGLPLTNKKNQYGQVILMR